MNIFLAPHNDDEALFGSYIIQRAKPIAVVVIYDGTQHERKFNISVEERRQESRKACDVLGVGLEFLGLPDDDFSEPKLHRILREAFEGFKLGTVFAPAIQGGNRHHDMVARAAMSLDASIMYYSTYAPNDLTPTGEMPLTPTKEEERIKEKALACYPSQLRINKPHFDAVKGQPEFLNFKP